MHGGQRACSGVEHVILVAKPLKHDGHLRTGYFGYRVNPLPISICVLSAADVGALVACIVRLLHSCHAYSRHIYILILNVVANLLCYWLDAAHDLEAPAGADWPPDL